MQISAFIITLVSFLAFLTTATFGSPVPVELAIASREPVADISAVLDTREFHDIRNYAAIEPVSREAFNAFYGSSVDNLARDVSDSDADPVEPRFCRGNCA